MNNFKKLLEYVNENKNELNELYEDLENDYVKKGLEICKFKGTKSQRIAILRRIVDLKVDPLLQEFKKAKYDEKLTLELRDKMYDFTALIHEGLHRKLITKATNNKILSEYNLALIAGVHKIGLVINKMQKEWQHIVIDENSKKFAKMPSARKFIQDNELYQKTPRGDVCDRSYGVVVFDKDGAKFQPYANVFLEDTKELEQCFDALIEHLDMLAISGEEKEYIEYFKKLKIAFLQTDNKKMIASWRDAEMVWMNVKSPLQVGHPLEYYEDAYTHAVALEWDIRLKEDSEFDEVKFKDEIKDSFNSVYKKIGANDAIMHSVVNSNIDKTQLYISTPMIYYGAELEGLFSAQVVPNDEFVSANSGKKIFAFVKHVYQSAKSKPFMRISSEIFEKQYLDYGREILFCKPEIWEKVYEVSTIGHEFGHLFFIDEESETLMNKSGVFKFIEEYKATTGGLINFFYHEDEALKLPVFDELIRRSVGLIAWQKVEHVRAYYCEGLIHLTLLFESGVLKFDKEKLHVKFDLDGYEKFKLACIKNYEALATFYYYKKDAAIFLDGFCELKDGIYLPNNKEAREFVEYFHNLYEEIGNETSDEEQKQEWISKIS
ncbi:invasion protein CiaB [Campylobacter geochelonis]|uniref:Invasion antigen B n=1 Tax=Campylobacter geochelonis TaxID=1780362 RepID=A0A128EF63_9BACT|nr:invasion protein CiaB [Campylobacter geochelonis]QKF71957.1 invasion antigen B [Campylobacter geochelonis]CZE47207.1 invasion antigen B [Campylobacter geochelonis]CZE47805.1 invasion antigen B [Campylobacter geochelonis]